MNRDIHLKHLQLGFTLIELMIVVIIIGVLSAAAVPAYRNYVKRSEVASVFVTMKSLITPAELWYQEHGSLAVANKDLIFARAGISATTNQVGTIDIPQDNTLTFSFNEDSSVDSTSQIQYQRSDTGWSCSVNDETIKTQNCPLTTASSPQPPQQPPVVTPLPD